MFIRCGINVRRYVLKSLIDDVIGIEKFNEYRDVKPEAITLVSMKNV